MGSTRVHTGLNPRRKFDWELTSNCLDHLLYHKVSLKSVTWKSCSLLVGMIQATKLGAADSKLNYQAILTKQRNLRQFLHFLEAVATVTELKCYRAEALSLFTVMLKCDKSTDYHL